MCMIILPPLLVRPACPHAGANAGGLCSPSVKSDVIIEAGTGPIQDPVLLRPHRDREPRSRAPHCPNHGGRLPDLRPRDAWRYDRAFPFVPLRKSPTAQPCPRIGSSP